MFQDSNFSIISKVFDGTQTPLSKLVGTDEEDKALARQRFKFYRDRGYEIKHFDEDALISPA